VARVRSPDRDQDQGGEQQPEEDGAGRAQLVEQGRRRGTAGLDRDDRGENEREASRSLSAA
jgi:hypothetical protein